MSVRTGIKKAPQAPPEPLPAVDVCPFCDGVGIGYRLGKDGAGFVKCHGKDGGRFDQGCGARVEAKSIFDAIVTWNNALRRNR